MCLDGIAPGLDGKPAAIFIYLLFESIGNRFLDLRLLKIDELARGMDTLGPNGLLFGWKRHRVRIVTHQWILCEVTQCTAVLGHHSHPT